MQEGGACGALGFLIDIFNMFFGGEGKILREKRDKREKNSVCRLSATIENLNNSTTKKLFWQKNAICNKHEGESG